MTITAVTDSEAPESPLKSMRFRLFDAGAVSPPTLEEANMEGDADGVGGVDGRLNSLTEAEIAGCHMLPDM
jgi:hypothetical protein